MEEREEHLLDSCNVLATLHVALSVSEETDRQRVRTMWHDKCPNCRVDQILWECDFWRMGQAEKSFREKAGLSWVLADKQLSFKAAAWLHKSGPGSLPH